MHRVRVGLLATLAFGCGIPLGPVAVAQVRLLSARGSPQVQFACGELRAALKTRGETAASEGLDALAKRAPKQTSESIRIVIAASSEESRSAAQGLDVKPLAPNAVAQAYAIRKHSSGGEITYAVLAADATGAMYGGLDLAEAVRLGTLVSVTDSDHAPFIANRGIKFNIPLDARTPTLTKLGDTTMKTQFPAEQHEKITNARDAPETRMVKLHCFCTISFEKKKWAQPEHASSIEINCNGILTALRDGD